LQPRSRIPLKLVFAGTPPFAATALRALHSDGHEIALVLTQPDRPAGRGMKVTPSAVSLAAMELNLPVEKFASLKDASAQSRIKNVRADLMVVAAYGLLLPQAVLEIPSLGCVNIHASLLPRWRGAAPIQRAIQAGDETTGICIMQMEAGLDTGPILLRREIPIAPDDTSATLLDKLTSLGAETIAQALAEWGRLSPQAQPTEGVTYAKKLHKTEAHIDWSKPVREIECQIRAFDPYPGSDTTLKGESIKIWKARAECLYEASSEPGVILRAEQGGIGVACGTGRLVITVLQKPGGTRLSAGDFLLKNRLNVGERLGN